MERRFRWQVKVDAWRRGCGIGRVISLYMARHRLKHPIDNTDMKVRMPVQARAEFLNEGHRTKVQRRLDTGLTGALTR